MPIFSAQKIFTGEEWLTGQAIVINHKKIENILSSSEVAASELIFFKDCFIVPAFIDAQVYGAAKKLFSVYPEASTLQLMYNEFVKQGTCLFLPTLATNSIEVFKNAIDAVKKYWKAGGKGVYGLHLEGPWLNKIKSGAHVKEWIHAPTVEEVKELLQFGNGVIKMITIAPEVCSDEVMNLLLSHQVIISAGHSNATYDEAIKSFNNGISMVTHLYNAMSPLLHRAPGLVGAAFQHQKVFASIIPDGYHVDFAAIAIAKKMMGERLFAITDAVTETHVGPYQHQLAGNKYECNEVLSGSALSMHKAFKNMIEHAGIEMSEALRMCSLYPAQLLRCDDEYGRIAVNASANFLVLNQHLEMVEVITSQKV